MRHIELLLRGCALLLPVAWAVNPQVALAQRTGENAVVQSSDAFGHSVGNEKTGLYTSEDVRGFNPVDAGNVRVEGLYFDQISQLPGRLIDSNTVRVGITAQGYPFPAPTGLVDFALTKPDEQFSGSFSLEGNQHGGVNGSIEAKLPIDGERFGISGGFGFRAVARTEGGRAFFSGGGTTLAWRPYKGAEVLAIGGLFLSRNDEARPTLFPLADGLPPEIERRRFFGQDWAKRDFTSTVFGVVAKLPSGDWRLEAALMRQTRKSESAFADVVTGVTPDGRASGRTIVADGNNFDGSTSGELRLIRNLGSDALTHQLTLNLRGRMRDRRFGGTVALPLGPSFADRPDPRLEPAYALGAENLDRVRQATFGAAYRLNWAGRGSFDASVAKSFYRKSIDFADPLRADTETRDRPLLWNVAGSLIVTSKLAFYASYVAGQEEALVAPDIASNRAEAPPAIRTSQYDAGLRYALTPDLSLVAGVFQVTKPYFNLDPARRYRQLGTVRNRGIELSLAGKIRPGLSLVAGTVLLDPRISGEAVATGLIGDRPVGQVRRRSILNLDWRQNSGRGPLSFDLALESLSARMGNASNTLEAPGYTTLTVGARYRFDLFGKTALLRPQVQNLLNEYGWQVSPSGGFTYNQDRTASLHLIIDF